MTALDLSTKNYDRYFVFGRVLGDSSSFIQTLYDQNFNYKDALILNGDFIDITNPAESASICEFIKQNPNCFATKGAQEVAWLENSEDMDKRAFVNYQLLNEFEAEYKDFISELPLIIKMPGHYFSVYAGVQPNEGVQASDENVFVRIGHYDVNSRFYQFANNEKKNWFDFKIFDGTTPVNIVFSAVPTDTIKVNAGYNLYRESVVDPMKVLIITKDVDPIILM